MHLLSKIKLILSSHCHLVVKNEYIYACIAPYHSCHPLCILCIYLYLHAIGSSERITLLEFEAMGEEDQQETQQQAVPEGEGQVQEELPECPDHKPLAYLKGKPRGILSL